MATPVSVPGSGPVCPYFLLPLSISLEQMFSDILFHKLIKDLDKRRKAASKKAAS
ncbi:hypothetical protein I8Q49_22630 [Acinetobacter baumannii]|nr:hypothetical protein [Acinetobacter baumannii]